MLRRSVPLFTVLTAAGLLACSDSPTDSGPRVALTPAAADVQVGRTVSLSASVFELTDSTVTWASDCGDLQANGRSAIFTAPWAPQSCTATVTSVENPTLSATAELTVVPVPAADNLLAPAGFDTDASPFEMYVTQPPRVEWAPEDARGSTTSGSMRMTHAFGGNGGIMIALEYCFTPEAGAEYRAGGNFRFENANPQTTVIVAADVYSDGCENRMDFLGQLSLDGDSTDWTPDTFTFTAPEGSTRPIRISVGIWKQAGNNVDTSALVDDLFLMRID